MVLILKCSGRRIFQSLPRTMCDSSSLSPLDVWILVGRHRRSRRATPRPAPIDGVGDVAKAAKNADRTRQVVTYVISGLRLLAAELGCSNVTVAEAWRDWGLRPWKSETFKFSTDPELRPRSATS